MSLLYAHCTHSTLTALTLHSLHTRCTHSTLALTCASRLSSWRAVCSLASAFGLSTEACSLLLWRPECGRNTLFVADEALQQLVEPSSKAGFKFVAVGAGGIKYKPPQHPGISSPRTEKQLFSQPLCLSFSLHSQNHTLTYSLSLVLVVMMRSKELKTSRSIRMPILSQSHNL